VADLLGVGDNKWSIVSDEDQRVWLWREMKARRKKEAFMTTKACLESQSFARDSRFDWRDSGLHNSIVYFCQSEKSKYKPIWSGESFGHNSQTETASCSQKGTKLPEGSQSRHKWLDRHC
jgi:hypothetical protein